MSKRTILSREDYALKFQDQMNELNYIPQEGELIIQCHESYPPYWFISNKGYLFSVYNNLKVIAPCYDQVGKANNKGERKSKDWRYATRLKGAKNLTRYTMARMILDHFSECEFETDEKIVAHHIYKKNNFESNEAQKCNNITNLQLLPQSVHTKLTQFAAKTSHQLDEELENKITESGCPTFEYTQSQLETILKETLKCCKNQGLQPTIYITSLDDDVTQIKAEAHTINFNDISL